MLSVFFIKFITSCPKCVTSYPKFVTSCPKLGQIITNRDHQLFITVMASYTLWYSWYVGAIKMSFSDTYFNATAANWKTDLSYIHDILLQKDKAQIVFHAVLNIRNMMYVSMTSPINLWNQIRYPNTKYD